MENIAVRYIVDDVEKSINFYRDHLDFKVNMNSGTGFAMLTRQNLNLFINQPGAGGAGEAMPDGTKPESGGWNRIQIAVDDLESLHKALKSKGLEFRNDIVTGRGGKQVLLKDPSGNLIELFERARERSVS